MPPSADNIHQNRLKKQKFRDPKLKAQYLYGDIAPQRAIAKLVFNGLLVAFFLGLFTFVDKLMLIDLIPNCANFSFKVLFSKDFIGLSQTQIFMLSKMTGWFVTGSDFLIRAAVTLTFPLSGLLFAIPALYIIGTAVRYSQAVAVGSKPNIKMIWQNSIYGTLIFTFFGMTLMFLLVAFVTPTQTAPVAINDFAAVNTKFHGAINGISIKRFYDDCLHYYQSAYKDEVWWAQEFLYELACFLWLSSLDGIFNSVIRGEGHINFITIVNIACVCLNILLDWVLISIAQIGMLGAATATIIGWTVETICLIIYVEMKLKYHISMKDLFEKKLKLKGKTMLGLAAFGSTVFISQIGLVIVNVCFINEISIVANHLYPGFGAEYVLGVMGAVAPIITLFLQPVFGTLRYGSPYFSFNYAQHRYKRFEQGNYLIALYVLIYGVFFYIFVCLIPPITNGFLFLFRLTNKEYLAFATHLLRIWYAQIMLISLSLSSMLVFLASNRVKIAIAVNIIRSLLIPLPCIYIFAAIALSTHSIWWYFVSQPVTSAISGTILFIWSAIFSHINVKVPMNHAGKIVLPKMIRVIAD